jgi:hypothetical protein
LGTLELPHSDGGGKLEDWQVGKQAGVCGGWMIERLFVFSVSSIYAKNRTKNCTKINTIYF